MKTSVAGALLASYKLLWPSTAQAGSLPSQTQRAGHEVIHNTETDPFGVTGQGKNGPRKSRLGFELCPGGSNPGNKG